MGLGVHLHGKKLHKRPYRECGLLAVLCSNENQAWYTLHIGYCNDEERREMRFMLKKKEEVDENGTRILKGIGMFIARNRFELEAFERNKKLPAVALEYAVELQVVSVPPVPEAVRDDGMVEDVRPVLPPVPEAVRNDGIAKDMRPVLPPYEEDVWGITSAIRGQAALQRLEAVSKLETVSRLEAVSRPSMLAARPRRRRHRAPAP